MGDSGSADVVRVTVFSVLVNFALFSAMYCIYLHEGDSVRKWRKLSISRQYK